MLVTCSLCLLNSLCQIVNVHHHNLISPLLALSEILYITYIHNNVYTHTVYILAY